MTFDEWHDKQNEPYPDGNHCPHLEWERKAWLEASKQARNEALEEAAAFIEDRGNHGGYHAVDPVNTAKSLRSKIVP